MDNYLKNPGMDIKDNLENIIARSLDISSSKYDITKLDILYYSLKIIIDNIEHLLQYLEKIENIYQIFDNIFLKISTTENFKYYKFQLDNLQGFLNILNSKVFSNIINGQNIFILNQNYATQLNKVSSLNIQSLRLSNFSENKKIKKTRVKIIKNSSTCDDLSALCISKDKVFEIMQFTNSFSIGFQGQLNKGFNLPIQEKQFSNSLNFTLFTEEKNGKMRILQENITDLGLSYEIRLKLQKNLDNTNFKSSACVQYTKNEPYTSCQTWYDLEKSLAVCTCNKQALTVNIIDETIANESKIKQFPYLNASICIRIYIKFFN